MIIGEAASVRKGAFFVRGNRYAVIVYSSKLWENKQLRKAINAYF